MNREQQEQDTEENGEDRDTIAQPYIGNPDFSIPSLSLAEGSDNFYSCPTHGDVTATIIFDLPDQEEPETYCIACWRDSLREHMGRLQEIPRETGIDVVNRIQE